ncbi:MAG: RecX family transcriptional regulator [Ignavibacteriales bacterium]|nr:RecX family transcriptional regulator [Ignavibacteriales bacterium]
MLITRIQKVRRARSRYEISLDEKPAFHVSESLLVKAGLFTGKSIDQGEIDKLLLADACERANQIAVNFISYRPRSSKEVTDKLVRKGFTEDIVHAVVEHLREIFLINDLEFARMFVRDKLRGKPVGRALLRRKLMEKGISFQATERVIKEYVTDENEQEAARTLATRKLKMSGARFSDLEPAVRQKRLADYLLNRGFSTEVAYKTARSILR